MKSKLSFLIIVIFIGILSLIFVDGNHQDNIKNKIIEMNGEVINIEYKTILSDQPFIWVNKNDMIYKVTYRINDREEIAWVIFRLLGSEWVFNE